jgi:membrane-bound lytic murein transglycosylase A
MAVPRCAFVIAGAMVLAALTTAGHAGDRWPIKFPNTQYEPVSWSSLDGWAGDDHATAFAAFLESCRALKGSAGNDGAIAQALKHVCARGSAAVPLEEDGARKFFEDNFRPLRISKLGQTDGFLTGYFEPIIDGSRVPTGEFQAPLYRRPPNLAIAGRLKLGDAFPSKGVKVGRRVGRRKIVPYYDRGEIEDGALDGWHLEICWLRSQLDVLFAQIQGSARIRLEDGEILRVNYDSHNGWPYTPIGRVLIDRKIMSKDEASMQRIRDWMEANPDQAKDVRRQNKSYIFFRTTDLSNEDEAVGGEGVPLMPGRSIAVDRSLHVYGTPFFIAANLPITNTKAGTKFRRLLFAQDTGSAIVGPARADIYFGAGDEAGRIAGRIRNPGQFVMLVPREVDPSQAAANIPLPLRRPSRSNAQTDGTAMIDPADEDVPPPLAKPVVSPSRVSPTLVPPGRTPPTLVPPGRASPTLVPPGRTSPTLVSPSRTPPTLGSPSRTSPTLVPPSPASRGLVSPSRASRGIVPPSPASRGLVSPSRASPTLASPSRASPSLVSTRRASRSLASPSLASPVPVSRSRAAPKLALPRLGSPKLASPGLALPAFLSPSPKRKRKPDRG